MILVIIMTSLAVTSTAIGILYAIVPDLDERLPN